MAVFLLPPDFETWQSRLSKRYGDGRRRCRRPPAAANRLEEIEQLLNTNYYMALINEDLDETSRRSRP